jgi:hypothetical protein
VFVANATTGMNVVARRPAGAEDEVPTTDLEYGAVDSTWDATGARIVRAPFESLLDHVTEATRARSAMSPADGRSCRSPSSAARARELGLLAAGTARTRQATSRRPGGDRR